MASEGKLFEGDWKDSCDRSSFFHMRLRDSAKWTQGDGASFTPSQPCDTVLHSSPILWLLELKSTVGASISFFPYIDDHNNPWTRPKDSTRQVMIKPNQVRELREFVKKNGVLAGFICNFRPRILKSGTTENKVYFVHILDFIDFTMETGKSSISETDCQEIGIEVLGTLKKVKYKYDIVEFVDSAIPFYMNKKYITREFLVSIRDWLNIII